jgi:hypothetical protein
MAVVSGAPICGGPIAWSSFMFPYSMPQGDAVRLAEDNRTLAPRLPHAVFAHPWRWEFGDHTRAGTGTRVWHTYHQAGRYCIAVLAYYPGYDVWLSFDAVAIDVR